MISAPSSHVMVLVFLVVAGNAIGDPPSPYHSEAAPNYDCGTNCLYVLCRITDRPIGYDRCAALLPPRRGAGTSLLEFKRALLSAGFGVEAYAIRPEQVPGIGVPAVLLLRQEPTVSSEDVGHYVVVRPLSGGRMQYLDFPYGPPVSISSGEVVTFLRSKRVSQLYVLLCGKPGQTIGEPAVPPGAYLPAGQTSSTAPFKVLTKVGLPQVAEWDFGEVAEGDVLRHAFVFENRTGRLLAVSSVKADCGCSDVNIDKTKLADGEQATLLVTVSLSGRSGPLLANILVRFSDESQVPPARFRASGHVRSRWIPDKPSIDLGRVRPDANTVRRSVKVHAIAPRSTEELADARCPLDAVRATVRPSGAVRGGERIIDIECDPARLAGIIQTQIELYSTGQKDAVLIIPVTGEVFRPLYAMPTEVLANAGSDGRAMPKTFVVATRELERIGSVRVAIDGFKGAQVAHAPTPGDPKRVRITVELPTVPPGVTTGAATVEVFGADGKNSERLAVPIIAVSRP